MSEESSVEDTNIYFISMFMLYLTNIYNIKDSFNVFTRFQEEVEDKDSYQDVLEKCLNILRNTEITDDLIEKVFEQLRKETLFVINKDKDEKEKLVGLDNLDTVKKEIKDGLFNPNPENTELPASQGEQSISKRPVKKAHNNGDVMRIINARKRNKKNKTVHEKYENIEDNLESWNTILKELQSKYNKPYTDDQHDELLYISDKVNSKQFGGKCRKSRRNRKSKKGKRSRKARKSCRKSNRRRGRR